MSLRTRLVALSFLMLFVELALIRWTGSNIVYLSYFSNFVLLGSFLGIGLGFLRAHARVNLWPWAPVGLATLVAFVLLFPVQINRSGGELIYFGEFYASGLPTWVTLPLIFIVVAAVMAMIGEGVARVFARFEPLEAYRLDVFGAILGIVAFSILSFLRAPPVAWGVIVAALFFVLLRGEARFFQLQALIAIVVLLAIESLNPAYSWSPYYRVEVNESEEVPASYEIDVNGIPHQRVTSTKLRRATEPLYFLPYERAANDPLEDVLVVGAGNGGDVAIALRHGADHVDAVEIDPRIYQIGKELNPDQPYDDRRVHVYVDDGRAFLELTDKRYDLILFALPDSLTLVAGQSSLRLESYLFTHEAMVAARDHLKPQGVFGMYNYYREPWLIDRLARTLAEVYRHPPCFDYVGTIGHLALLTASRDPAAIECDRRWEPTVASIPEPARDDHPFLYLKTNSIPSFYLLTIALILAASLLAVRAVAGPLAQMARYADLFFMGVAFLLLETKNVVQFALLFGTTWFVNALVFAGILLTVLAAVEVARHVTFRRPRRLYALLLVALAIAWVVPADALLQLALPLRFLSATVLAFAPIFLANLVFAERFRSVGSSTVAFGANLLGAMIGGVLEYSALVVGYRALLVVAALLYGLAFALSPWRSARCPAA